MRIRSGGYEVLATGLALSHGDSDVEFVISDLPLMIVAARLQKAEGAKPSIEIKVEDLNRVIFVFTNPDSLNFGPAGAVEVGTIGGKVLSASVRINVFGDYTSFEVAYSFFLSEGATK
jgi:hypothetical protein